MTRIRKAIAAAVAGAWFALSAVSPATAAPATDERNVEAVLELLTHLKIDSIGDDLFAMMAERAVPKLRHTVPNLPEEAYALLHEELSAAFKAGLSELMLSNVRFYMEHLTPEEVDELNAFYATKTGRKMLEVMPMLMQQSLYMGQE